MLAKTIRNMTVAVCLALSSAILPGQDLATTNDVSQLMAVLKNPSASDHEKAVACERLAVLGTAEAVPLLRELLLDPKFSHYARYALEPIPSPLVDEALREALLQGEPAIQMGILNSLGNRRDTAAIPLLADFLTGANAALAGAAASALGRIGTPEAAGHLMKALRDVRPEVRKSAADGLLVCADRLQSEGHLEAATSCWEAAWAAEVPLPLQIAAVRGIILGKGPEGVNIWKEQLYAENDKLFDIAIQVGREIPANLVVPVIGDALTTLPAARAAVALDLMVDVAPREALSTVRKLASQSATVLRHAAIRCLGKIGDASDVPLLLGAALDEEAAIANEAREALASLPGEEVNQVCW